MKLSEIKEGLKHGKLILKSGEKEVDDINEADQVAVGEKTFKLDEETDFFEENPENPEILTPVLFCFINEQLSIVEYKKKCQEKGIKDFKFLVRTELNTWLKGASDSCKFLIEKTDEKPDTKDATAPGKKREYEQESVDHNDILHGSKNLEFGGLIKDGKKMIEQLNKKKKVERKKSTKTPIVLLSPLSSALLSLSNIRKFLEESEFVDPLKVEKTKDNAITINHKGIRLLVVDNVDSFTRPDYWDRVVGVFTTGQAWQFSKYKYNNPELLFLRYPGYYIGYSGDVVPRAVDEWNVQKVFVDKEKRFRDKMVVNDVWASLERTLRKGGYL